MFALLSDSETYTKDSNLPTTLQGQTAIVPTILSYFDLPIPELLDSSYIGDNNLDNNTFYVATQTIDIRPDTPRQYPPRLMKNWSGISEENAKKISGILKLTETLEMEEGKPTNKEFYYFFLNNGRYLQYDIFDNQVFLDGDISEKWGFVSTEDAKEIVAASKKNSEKTNKDIFFLLKNGRKISSNSDAPIPPRLQINAKDISATAIIPPENPLISGRDIKEGLAIFLNNGSYVQDSENGVTKGETEKSLYGMAPYSKNIIAAVSDGNYVNFFISMKNDLYGKQPLETKA